MSAWGLLLAAGEGRRYGSPKALAEDPDGTSWLRRALAVLRDGGCAGATVVLGAGAPLAAALVPDDVDVVVADDWAEGMGASLRAGLGAEVPEEVSSYVVMLVDLPDVSGAVIARLVALDAPGALARAAYDGSAGHPVLIGRDHAAGVIASAVGDRGARDYLRAHDHDLVECGDLATGVDVDTR